MPAPIPDQQRETVLDLARAGHPRNEVARLSGVSPASVTRICSTAGVSFDRTATAAAVEARVIDMKQARGLLASGLLDDVAEARHRLHRASEAREFLDLARAVAALTNAHVRIISVDGTDQNTEEARSMLGNLMAGLAQVWNDQQDAQQQPDEGTPQ
ncbi:hypothetical protein ACFVVA_28940 [Kitasatospora sp. NPDC058048]|uniref:hypothetical protein n=1 Tax=Kitasatospora sp. NPDC058048 TaxID=3346313 RepID=UPI0036DCB25E